MRLSALIQICNLARMEVAAVIRACRCAAGEWAFLSRALHAIPSFFRSIFMLPLYVR